MRKHERLAAMLELVARDGALSVDDTVATFTVSLATARRDLDELAEQQLIVRTRGGGVAHNLNYDLPLRYKGSRSATQKRRIADAAAALVEGASVIGLNGGTTNSEVARSIATRADLVAADSGAAGQVTVVTNALNIANELAVRPQLKIVVTGGVLRPQSFELIGGFTSAMLANVTIDLMFLGVDALSPEFGAAAIHEGEAQINNLMVQRASRVVAVADGSKLDRRAFCTICPAADLDMIITDTDADPVVLSRFEQLGIEVRAV